MHFAKLSLVAVILLGASFQASLVRSLSAEDNPAAPKPDPILADLKTTAKAEWKPDFDNRGTPKPPSLEISVIFQGTAAAKASAFGELKLQSLLDQHGKSYRWACVPWGSPVFNGMDQISRRIESWHGGGVCLKLRIPNRPPIQSIRQLQGSLALQTAGEYQKVTVKDALKDLGEAAQEDGAVTGQWIADPIQDKNLDALGIKLAAKRRPIPSWNSDKKIKDNIAVEIQSNDPVTACEILDAKGGPIPDVSNGFSGSSPFWMFDFQTTAVVPPDARLRLTFHKNSRKIRVPFLLKDVAVPKIDAHDTFLNIPASPDEAFVEAETVPPGDPILAGLKLSAKAQWSVWSGSDPRPPSLQVQIELEGKPAEETSAYGEIEIESAVDGSGKPLDFQDDDGMGKRFCDPKFSVYLSLPTPPPLKKIRELRGTMALQTGGRFEVLIVKDLLKKIKEGKPIDDDALKAAGIAVTVEHKKNIGREFGGVESLDIRFEWKRIAVVGCDVFDEEGHPLKKGNASWGGENWWRSFKEPVPQGAELRIAVQRDSRKIRVPFDFKDIAVPKMPTEEDAVLGPGVAVPVERPVPSAK